MKIVYSDVHRAYDPASEIYPGARYLPYDETPARVEKIRAALAQTDFADFVAPDEFGLEPILAVHTRQYVEFLQNAWKLWQIEDPLPPDPQERAVLMASVFPPPRAHGRPIIPSARAGLHQFDESAPILAGTFEATCASANVALTTAHLVKTGERAAYALCRPPGHHAGRDYGGGYCYLNNAAIAARWLGGRVAILDVDYHAANGTQDIFYEDPRVLVVSLHADPAWEYPYFMGYTDEIGAGTGVGYNVNIPLPRGTDDDAYLAALESALTCLEKFAPDFLVLSLGLDIGAGDPIGEFGLTRAGFHQIARRIAARGWRTVIVQEGGYRLDTLGENAVAFLQAFA